MLNKNQSALQNTTLKLVPSVAPSAENNVKAFDAPDILLNTVDELAISNAVSAITTLSLLNANVIHIEFEYIPWLNDFTVKVFDGATNYMQGNPKKFGRGICLDKPDALEKLNALEDELIELVAEAKDKAMGAV